MNDTRNKTMSEITKITSGLPPWWEVTHSANPFCQEFRLFLCGELIANGTQRTNDGKEWHLHSYAAEEVRNRAESVMAAFRENLEIMAIAEYKAYAASYDEAVEARRLAAIAAVASEAKELVNK